MVNTPLQFEILKQIQEHWQREKPIIVHENEVKNGAFYFVIPGERVTITMLQLIKNYTNGIFSNTVPHDFFQMTKLPLLQTMYDNLYSTYFELSYFKHDFPSNTSLGINHTSVLTGNSFADIEATYVHLSDLVAAQYNATDTTKSIKLQFYNNFSIPGRVILNISHPKLLKGGLTIREQVIALSQITDQTPSIATMKITNVDTQDVADITTATKISNELDLLLIDSKFIRTMWRMLKKISKDKIKKSQL